MLDSSVLSLLLLLMLVTRNKKHLQNPTNHTYKTFISELYLSIST